MNSLVSSFTPGAPLSSSPEERRICLAPVEHAAPLRNVMVTLRGSLNGSATSQDVAVSFIPERWTLDAAAFSNYLSRLGEISPEDLAITLLDDLSNELVPKWVRVVVDNTIESVRQQVVVEDCQPGWSGTVPPLPA